MQNNSPVRKIYANFNKMEHALRYIELESSDRLYAFFMDFLVVISG